MTWQHAILEIYEPDSGWPTEGTSAEWIKNGTVGWCDGDVNDVLAFAPIPKIARAKLDYWWESLKWRLFWRWIDKDEKVSPLLFALWLTGKYDPTASLKEFEAWIESLPVVDDEDAEKGDGETA